MKIALIQRFLPSLSRGGAGFFAHGLANALVKRGHQVTVFTQHPLPPEAQYQIQQLPQKNSQGMDVLAFPFQIAAQDFSSFDVIHAQGDDHLLSGKRPPLVRTIHASSLYDAIHNGFSFHSPKLFFMYLYFYVCEIISCFRADVVTAVSKEVCKHYPRIRSVIGNGIDTELFSPRGNKAAHPTLLFVGQLNTRKRGWLVLKAFQEEIRPRLPQAELWLVTPEKVEEASVKWFGPLDQRKLSELYPQAWVFCLPSSSEGFGRGYVEAMASGTPVVATPNPGADYILQGGEYGPLVPDAKLGATLLELLSREDLRKQYRTRGLERAKIFSWENVVKEYEAAYQQALKKGTS